MRTSSIPSLAIRSIAASRIRSRLTAGTPRRPSCRSRGRCSRPRCSGRGCSRPSRCRAAHSSHTSQSWRLTRSQKSTASEPSKPALVHRLGLEEPLADDLRAARALRPQRVQHHVVRVQRDEAVREDREVQDGARVDAGDRRPAAVAAVERHRVGVLLGERHRAAAPGARALEVVAGQVVAEAVELGVHAGAVQALGVVLDDRLPVGGDVVVDPRAAPQLAGAVGVQVLDERADVVGQRRRDAGDVGEHEPAGDLGADRAQAVAGRVEVDAARRCAARSSVRRRTRSSTRGRGTAGAASCPRPRSASRDARWRQTLKNPRALPSPSPMNSRLSLAELERQVRAAVGERARRGRRTPSHRGTGCWRSHSATSSSVYAREGRSEASSSGRSVGSSSSAVNGESMATVMARHDTTNFVQLTTRSGRV